MKHHTQTLSLMALLALTGLSAPFGAAAKSAGSRTVAAKGQTAKEDITDLVAKQQAAWNAGDAEAFSVSFADDGSFTNVRGQLMYGHEAFEARHREIFSTFFKDSDVRMTITKLVFVRPDVAIADVYTVISKLEGRAPPGLALSKDGTLKTRLQEIFVRKSGVWRVASYHNVDIKGE